MACCKMLKYYRSELPRNKSFPFVPALIPLPSPWITAAIVNAPTLRPEQAGWDTPAEANMHRDVHSELEWYIHGTLLSYCHWMEVAAHWSWLPSLVEPSPGFLNGTLCGFPGENNLNVFYIFTEMLSPCIRNVTGRESYWCAFSWNEVQSFWFE